MNQTNWTPLHVHARNAFNRVNACLSQGPFAGFEGVRKFFAEQEDTTGPLILDDLFPQTLSAFRIAEYNTYLEVFESARVHSTATSFPLVGETRSFRAVVKEYEDRYPQHRGKVQKLRRRWRGDLRSSVVYTMFLNDAVNFVKVAEKYRCPFVFTLYPGGGFRLSDEQADNYLRRVFSSPSFRKVIVTQEISQRYLLDNGLCSADELEFIYGVVSPSSLLTNSAPERRRFPESKRTFDVCFVAHKYTHRGVDKGYDTFIEAARCLSKICNKMIFHVVGPFGAADIDVSDLRDKLRFYGTRPTEFFPAFYANMDVILSPNRAFMLGPGSFDGFPTGACVEAGLCGVVAICTDPLQQNISLQAEEEIVIVKPDVDDICQRVHQFYTRPENVYLVSARGQEAFRRIFNVEAQMKPRLRTLASLLDDQEVRSSGRNLVAGLESSIRKWKP